MLTQELDYQHAGTSLKGFIAFDDSLDTLRPAVLIAHDWSGRNQFACDHAVRLAKLGYVGFAVDVYGNAKQGQTNEEKMSLMSPFVEDRQLLQERLACALQTLCEQQVVDAKRVAAIGFCFGGLCVLDLARMGADIKGAVSFHGLLNPPDNLSHPNITAKILALHGHHDPMVTPEDVTAFQQEMTDAGADWQIHVYGQAKHAFTNPDAADETLGTVYNAAAANRAWQSCENFLSELFK